MSEEELDFGEHSGQCEFLYDPGGRCEEDAEKVVRPKNTDTSVRFGLGLMCRKHESKLVNDAQGSRSWETLGDIEQHHLDKMDLTVEHPNDRQLIPATGPGPRERLPVGENEDE